MDNKSRIEFPANCIRICFDQYGLDICSGRLCGVALENEIYFDNAASLVARIDDAFNIIGKPQPHHVLRSFGESENYQSYRANPRLFHTREEIAVQEGAAKTYDLIMTSRHKAEWQGFLRMPDGTMAGRFNSILQCMNLF